MTSITLRGDAWAANLCRYEAARYLLQSPELAATYIELLAEKLESVPAHMAGGGHDAWWQWESMGGSA